MTVGRPRASVAAMASYRPGKSVAMAADEHGLDLAGGDVLAALNDDVVDPA